MALGTVCLSLLLLVAVHMANSEYVAFAPKKFRAGSDFQVQVTVLSTVNGQSVDVEGKITERPSGEILAQDKIEVDNGKTKILTLEMNNPFEPSFDSTYELTLEGTKGLVFTNTTTIELDIQSEMILVQTDKKMYKPGDKVLFRVLALDPELKPLKVGKEIKFKNPNGTGVAKYTSASDSVVYEDEFQTMDFSPQGKYTISVKTEKSNKNYNFEVKEYVPPKFEVTATASPQILTGEDQTSVTVTVTATYTYGKGVQGDVLLKVGDQKISDKITDGSGTKDVMVDLSEELSDKNVNSRDIVIEVEVTDETNRMYSTQVTVKFRKTNPVTIEFQERSDQVYRPGTDIQVVVKVTLASGQPYTGSELMKIALKKYSEENPLSTANVAGNNGIFIWTVAAPTKESDALFLSAEITIDGQRYETTRSLQKYETVGTATLNAWWTKYTTAMWDTAEFAVEMSSTGDFAGSELFYMVISRGQIIKEGTVQNKKEIDITPEHCPKTTVVVYGLAFKDGKYELIADSLQLKLKGCQNKVVKPTGPQTKQTGEDAEIKFQVSWTDKNKQSPIGVHDVYVLAVDKSIILMQEENPDLTPDKVDEELRKFQLVPDPPSYTPSPFVREKRSVIPPGPYYGNAPTSTGQLLKSVGLKVLADANMKEGYYYEENWRGPIALAGGGGAEMMEDGDGGEVPESVDSAIPPEDWNEVLTVRQDFPDTWIWKSAKTDGTGSLTMVEELPDSITSWVVSAFAVRYDSEIALTEDPAEIAAVNPFFVDVNLPYSIRRYEGLVVRATVFNYHESSTTMTATITLKQSQDFEIVGSNSGSVTVKSGVGNSVEFTINATTVKTITLEIEASGKSQDPQITKSYRDVVFRDLIVKPEGQRHTEPITRTVELTSSDDPYEEEIPFDYSQWKVIPDSENTYVEVVGDMMGTALRNVDKLVTQPTGCGEQNMITLIPNIYAMRYLDAVNDLTAEFEAKAKKYMVSGYRREQEYRFDDGGYSAFGESDGNASTWLTAFVVRSFVQAYDYIESTVDIPDLEEDIDFLLSKMNEDGSFKEDGRVIHDDMQGGSASGDALSVYVTMSLLEALKKGFDVYSDKVTKAFANVKEVARGITGGKEQQFLAAITAYTLLLKDPINPDDVDNLIKKVVESGAPWNAEAKPAGQSGMETTAYCILAYNGLGTYGDASPLVTWMQGRQNYLGGYGSTQETVMALEALSQYAVHTSNPGVCEVTVTAETPVQAQVTFTVDQNNKRIVQTEELPSRTTKVKVKVQRNGAQDCLAVVKIVWDFYVNPEGQANLRVTTTTRPNGENKLVTSCIEGVDGFEYNNMMIVSMDLPSGYKVANKQETMDANPIADRIEVEDNMVHYYLSGAAIGKCVTVTLEQIVEVKKVMPGTVVVYAYYDKDEIYAASELKVDSSGPRGCEEDQSCRGAPLVGMSHLVLTSLVCVLVALLLAL